MSIDFVIGRSGTGKSHKIHTRILDESLEDPSGRPVILLVPEQMTFQAERELLALADRALTRVQVLSFPRLAFRLLQETGGAARKQISKNGIHAMLRQITDESRNELELYKNSLTAPGFIQQLERMLTECKRYQLSCTMMQEAYESLDEKEHLTASEKKLRAKLHDFSLVHKKAEETLSGKYVEAEDLLQLTAEAVPSSAMLEKSRIYIDGFHSFTPVEEEIVKQLMKKTEVTMTLVLDEEPEMNDRGHPLDLFFETASTLQQLKSFSMEEGISYNYEKLVEGHRFQSSGLSFIEQNIERFPTKMGKGTGIDLWEAVNHRTEVEHTAREIVRLVREENYRYRDIAVMTRNVEAYRSYIETIFPLEKIPFFMDNKKSALDHPLTEFIKSALETIEKGWPYEAVFRMIKTELLFKEIGGEEREQADILENYVLARGIRGKKWYEEEPWDYFVDPAEEDADNRVKTLEELRSNLIKPVRNFEKNMKKARSVRERAEALFFFLEEAAVPAKLQQMHDQSLEAGRLREAREHEQMWKETVRLLDDIVEISRQDKISLKIFRDMIEAGLESMQFSVIPPAFDQVLIADAETSRLQHVKAVFLLGVNEGIFPKKPDENGLLSEEERKYMEQSGIKLAPGAENQLQGESFLFYRAVTQASKNLYISYALQDAGGNAMKPSRFFSQTAAMFPEEPLKTKFESPQEQGVEHEPDFVTNPERSLTYMTVQLQQRKQGYNIHPVWWQVYEWYLNQNENRRFSTLLSSLTYKNQPVELKKSLSRRLYGKKINASVSRFEQFNACPFSQFSKYGLKLKERAAYKLEAPDIGLLFHAALKDVTERVQEENKDLRTLSRAEITRYAEEVVENLAPRVQREIFNSSDRYKYILRKLKDVVSRASIIMTEQAKRNDFVPVGFEIGFGQGEAIPPLQFTLSDETVVEVSGRVDRVDKAETSSGIYLRIVDYKSSSRDIKLDEVYHGLAMQMLVYLDVVISFADDWLGVEADPAGVLYFHVHNPVLKTNERLTLEEIEELLLKQFKMKGLLSSNEEVIAASDTSIESGWSNIAPVRLSKDGKPAGGSRTLAPDDYGLLRQYIRSHMQNLGQRMADGDISLTPYKKKQQIPCTYCSYKSFCQFDPSLDTNNYRTLPEKSAEEVIEAIRKQKGGKTDD
ncbi:helicase-exonuclease AddAB subunit AddB [Alkalicoccus saliphilus]|nr:helicase-exonuclease AddAB subunit AddB [Alkalicoccus saliphilus]